MVLTISSGHSASYLTDAVAAGRENYYTGAVAAGEPPGRWYGTGAEALGLSGLVDTQDMTALYECFLDPRDEHFRDPSNWGEASTLGHTGRRYQSEQQLYDAALDAEPTASAERRAELWLDAGKRARKNVAFLDATFSVQKSVTVLHTAFEAQEVAAHRAAADPTTSQQARAEAATAAASWATHKRAVEDAIWAGNRAALDYLAEHAGYSRVGHHGGAAGRFIDAHDWTVASFFQHDSRNHDPQLHIHNAILNRVQGTDGVWRTVDSRAIHKFRGAAAAVGERTMEEHLTRSLGMAFASRPDGKAREVVGVAPEVMELFSSRRRAITRHTATLVSAFETQFGREPNSLELDRLQRQATFATRNAKSHEGETVEARLSRWDAQLRAEVAGGLAGVASDVLARGGQASDAEAWSPAEVVETALADVQSKKAAWTVADLTRSISDALPDHVGTLDGSQVAALLDGLTAQAVELAVPLDAQRPGEDNLPDDLRLAGGRSAYDAPGGRLYATPEHVHSERSLVAATSRGNAPALAGASVQAFVAGLAEAGIELGADQAAAVRGVLTSGAAIESLVGPAGTGKSFVVGALAKAWQDPDLWDGQQRRVVGLASSQIATEVLAGEGLDARNVARWLATQQRLAEGRAVEEDQQWRLQAGDLVVVDESSMADTADLTAIHDHVRASGAKLLLTGDHRQLAAVGAGGGMELVAEAGAAYELAEARRFTQQWERDASLRLRAADETVLADYHKHGRLLDAGMLDQAEASAARAWLADTLAGRHSLLIVDTNEQAARVAADIRTELVRLGRVTEQGVPLGRQGTYAGTGDLVQARLNGWDLAGYESNRRGPINREQYRVLDTRDDGGLVVAPLLGNSTEGEQLGEPMTLPGRYVAEHVSLGYASTVHAAQGLTVDTCHTVASPATTAEALYVGMSRGRQANTAHVTTATGYTRMTDGVVDQSSGLVVPADAPGEDVQDEVRKSPNAVLAGILDTVNPEQSALATATVSAQNAESVRTPAELLADASELATAGRTARWLDELVDAGHLSDLDRVRLAAEDGGPTLSRVLRRAELAGHDPHQVLVDAVKGRSLADSRQLTNVIHHRITAAVSLDPQGSSFTDWTPKVDDPQWQRYLDTLAQAADARQQELGERVAAEQPQWAVEALGAPPEGGEDLADWTDKAAAVAAYRELSGHEDPTTALGSVPKTGQVEAYASWRAAWRALGRPEADRDELEMTDGRLRVRVRAYRREETWAPRYVANELAGTRQEAERCRQIAAIRAAEVATATDAAQRAVLEQGAREAAALAHVLDQRVTELEAADQARAEWLVHTAATRAAHDRAQAELSSRGIDATHTVELVTAEEWLATHASTELTEDPHRAIVEDTDLTDAPTTDVEPVADQPEPTVPDVDATPAEPVVESVETGLPDIREAAAVEPAPVEEDIVRVPSADETADTIARAQRALAEIQERHAVEEHHATEEDRAEQLARWHADDVAAEIDTAARDVDYDTPGLEVAVSGE